MSVPNRPSTSDAMLLRFLFHVDPDEARAAWARWRPDWDPDAPTPEQYRLFPLLAERVAALVPDEPKLGMLQGVRRQATVQTLLMLEQLDSTLATLHEAGLQAVVLKGAALGLSVYGHVGQRPFGDLDVMVDPRHFGEAVSALGEEGWVEKATDYVGNHAVTLERSGFLVDLHRKPFKELVLVGRPHSGWDLTETVVAGRRLRSGREIRIQAPADALVHTIAHGTHAKWPPLLRWVGDTRRLIQTAAIDWDRVERLASLFEMQAALHEGLDFVRDVTGTEPPSGVLHRLAASGEPRSLRRRLASFHHFPDVSGPLGGLPLTGSRLFQATLDQPLPRAMASSPAYLAAAWGAEEAHQLPGALARRAWRRWRPRNSSASLPSPEPTTTR